MLLGEAPTFSDHIPFDTMIRKMNERVLKATEVSLIDIKKTVTIFNISTAAYLCVCV